MRVVKALVMMAGLAGSWSGWAVPIRGSEVEQATQVFELPFELVDNRIIVTAQVNGDRPVRLLLDTGADAGFLTSAVAERLRLKVAGNFEQHGTGSAAIRVGLTDVRELRIGQGVWRNLRMQVTADDGFKNVFGSLSPDGVIGKPVFEQYVIAMDYQRRKMTFTPPEQYRAPANDVVVRFDLPAQIPIVEAELDGVGGRFGVDSGARSSLLLFRPFAEEHKLRERYKAHVEGVTGWGLGGPIRSLLARSEHFSIGGFDVKGSVVRLSTLRGGVTTSSDMAGLIGPDVLARFIVTFDYPRKRMLLETSSEFFRVDSYDRAGVWMGQDGKGFFAVDVVGGGPADGAGVVKGDRLLKIDDVATAGLALPEVRERMRRGVPGSSVKMLVEHGGVQRLVTVKLKDMV